MRLALSLVVLCVVLAVATVLLWLDRQALLRQIEALRRAPPVVSERVREVLREVPSGQPVRTTVKVVDRPVPVEVTRTVERVVVQPGRTEVVERIVTVTEPVPCRSEEECRRMFAQAPQRITVDARLVAGTPVPIEVDGEVREVRLARDVPLRIDLVSSEGGVYAAVVRPDSPVAVDRVTTVTTVTVSEPHRSPWKVLLAQSDRFAAGLAWEALQVSSLSVDLGALYSPSDQQLRAGAGLSYRVSPSLSVGAMYATDSRLWAYVGIRF